MKLTTNNYINWFKSPGFKKYDWAPDELILHVLEHEYIPDKPGWYTPWICAFLTVQITRDTLSLDFGDRTSGDTYRQKKQIPLSSIKDVNHLEQIVTDLTRLALAEHLKGKHKQLSGKLFLSASPSTPWYKTFSTAFNQLLMKSSKT